MLSLCFSSSQSKEAHAMQRLHCSIGSSSHSLLKPKQAPLPSFPAVPHFFCKLHFSIRCFIRHCLQTIFFPVVQPSCLAKYAAQTLLTPFLVLCQPITLSPHISQKNLCTYFSINSHFLPHFLPFHAVSFF